jgi:hypothetical protein
VADYIVQLVGGPCDGDDRTLTQAQLDAGELTCKGTIYVRSNDFPSSELIVFATADAIKKATGSKAPAHITTAWTRWMRALAHKGPAAHNRIQKATVRARRIARKR